MTRFPLIAVLLFVGVSAVAQTEKEVKDLLCHKWKITHVESGGIRVAMPAEAGDFILDFKADGSVLKIDSRQEQKGKWTYDHNTKTITTDDAKKGQEKLEIIKITVSELVLKVNTEEKPMNLVLKRF